MASNHRLHIETGRHTVGRNNKIPREQRVCEQCPQTVEDEYHVFRCPSYTDIRETFGVTVNSDEEIITFLQTEAQSTQQFIKQIVRKLYSPDAKPRGTWNHMYHCHEELQKSRLKRTNTNTRSRAYFLFVFFFHS